MVVKRALISVSNKEGVVELARGLAELGVEIISTGGTYKTLAGEGLRVKQVSSVTGFPEILDGRVKTLHPAIHGGILALREPEHQAQLAEHGIEPIDMVVVNLYPFVETVKSPGVTLAEAIENIDIGGPSMLRSAAKNYRYVLVVTDPRRYGEVLALLQKGEIDQDFRLRLALDAFSHTAAYDAAISSYLGGLAGELFPAGITVSGTKIQDLRYGENPHQNACFYRDRFVQGPCVASAEQIWGKELSYNNILDLNAALELVREFNRPAAVVIKHNNPCGTAVADSLAEAYRLAYEGDPVSAFGGIVALNQPVDPATARSLAEIFLEAVIAPDFEAQALAVLQQKKDLRLLKVGSLSRQSTDRLEIRKVNGGFLLQEFDRDVLDPDKLRVVTQKKPAGGQMEDLLLAMTVVKHVKSNAIVVAKNGQIIGVGAGQMNRVGSARIALEQAGEKARGAVMGSDAFFPFSDTVDEAARAGISAIIQPGGSVRDEESIKKADEYGIVMVFTGMRHFKH